MVRGFAVGNLVIGSAMAAVTVLVLLALKIQGAVILGIMSGFLHLIPFLGVMLARNHRMSKLRIHFATFLDSSLTPLPV